MTQHVNPESFGFLIADVYRLIKSTMDRAISNAGIGVTPGEARTLVHAARAGAVRQNVLAERMGVEAMTLSGYLDRLEARDLVRRANDPSDRRAKLVELTDKADAVLEAIGRVGTEMRRSAAGTLSEAEWDEMLEKLKVVRANLAGLSQKPAAPRQGEPL
ncbi:winged helix-turn-helix transcriptional regulator [Nitratireductor aquimarinus]|uniref:MarR family winged helix-turn-helix transcriptional regulator n=1 Tax=Nitratireductor TaxID=245876 RepID=UPI0019D3582B|nr:MULTISPECIES: MarR family winged helix-turn-helix transcriptional regulator [Nitratireductor]MBN7777266.1 winged helix-turn-helix transcriptional regulator [Nitratireductor pacificus]MBN7780937.1 winged helix-turn-helix transcriptional regulator [Nitratireductor pacificus]MBN7789743.1 winged helix-turn-helix transcriptional regulator [Nitratireductor aquimarinus]MBY6099475.1 MarR family winged helix-turn-helix transcriptional regulator [Nitratireductor aquimarinus]MCA1260233.1 MarR family w